MERRPKNRKKANTLNLDSLMDILTCTVGLMLFIVIFAVLEAHGVRIKMYTPMVKDAPENSERKLFICKNGTIRILDVNSKIDMLFANWKLNYENVPKIVQSANRKNVNDDFFRFELAYNEWEEGNYWTGQKTYRSIDLVVLEKSVSGETVEQISSISSKYEKTIQKFDNTKIWVAFSVDENSLEVFRKAREICIENDIATGWDPVSFNFPLRVNLIGGNQDANSDAPSILDTILE